MCDSIEVLDDTISDTGNYDSTTNEIVLEQLETNNDIADDNTEVKVKPIPQKKKCEDDETDKEEEHKMENTGEDNEMKMEDKDNEMKNNEKELLQQKNFLKNYFLKEMQQGKTLLAEGVLTNEVEELANAFVVFNRPDNLLEVLQENLPPNVVGALIEKMKKPVADEKMEGEDNKMTNIGELYSYIIITMNEKDNEINGKGEHFIIINNMKEEDVAMKKIGEECLLQKTKHTTSNLADQSVPSVQQYFLQGETLLAEGVLGNGVEHLANALAVCGRPNQVLEVQDESLPPNAFDALVEKVPATMPQEQE